MITGGKRPVSAEDAATQVALASRIIAGAGHEDLTLGHVSVRGPEDNIVYIKRKGPPLGLLTPDDVLKVSLDDPNALDTPSMHLEAVMHLEVYRSRLDVGSVIHSHPPYATALSATSASLDFVSHDGILFHEGIGVYDKSVGLITTQEQGREVAHALGARRAVLLRNHGVLLVGEDVRWAVLAALTLERAIRLQILAGSLGSVEAIGDEWASGLFSEKYQDLFLDEYWAMWEGGVANEMGLSRGDGG